jgi:hypothetical protein
MIVPVFGHIVLGELFADFVGGHSDNGVLPGVKILRKLEELDADRALFQCTAGTVNGVFDDVLEELSTSFAAAKGWTFEQTVELGPNFLRLRLTQSLRIAFAHPETPGLHHNTTLLPYSGSI